MEVRGVMCPAEERSIKGPGLRRAHSKQGRSVAPAQRKETSSDDVRAVKVERLLSRLHCPSNVTSGDGDPFNAIFCTSIQKASGGALIVVMASCSVIIVCRRAPIMIIRILGVLASTLRGSGPLAVDPTLPVNPLPI